MIPFRPCHQCLKQLLSPQANAQYVPSWNLNRSGWYRSWRCHSPMCYNYSWIWCLCASHAYGWASSPAPYAAREVENPTSGFRLCSDYNMHGEDSIVVVCHLWTWKHSKDLKNQVSGQNQVILPIALTWLPTLKDHSIWWLAWWTRRSSVRYTHRTNGPDDCIGEQSSCVC